MIDTKREEEGGSMGRNKEEFDQVLSSSKNETKTKGKHKKT
jgi:hypothetical protein